MEDSLQKFSIRYRRILYADNDFIIETDDSARYRLMSGVSEHYILLNLAGTCKFSGTMVVELVRQRGKPCLLPVAVTNGDGVTWIATTPDERTNYPPVPNPFLFEHLKTDAGREYPDGFIGPDRTSLTYVELISLERTLHDTCYVEELYNQYRNRHPGVPLYDARLHYFMIKGIRNHKHYSDDFIKPCDEFTFYLWWQDPFPWYLYLKTFGKIDSWGAHAKMRLMADNRCLPGIPLALKVLASDKANEKIIHYAIVLAGMDEANTELIMSYKDKHPRAVARVLYERGSPDLYPMLLKNGRSILDGVNDDILDDFPVIHSQYYDRLEQEYTINHRGFIRMDSLTEAQVRELWEIYRRIAQKISETNIEDERLRLGNAFRAFLLAVIYNCTPFVAEILDEVYRNFNFLLYSEWSQDSSYKRMDIMWATYLYRLVVQWDIVDNLWQWLQFHAKRYDHYYLLTNQRFFLTIYSKVAYHVLDPTTFYDALAPLIDSDYCLVEDIWMGVTGDEYLGEDDAPLDHRWEDMFRKYNYYTWTGPAMYYYSLVRHRIQPPPSGWKGKWEPKEKKLGIVVPR